MLKNCTKLLSTLLLLLGVQGAMAQGTVVWPTADAATIAASQFSDSSQIFKPTTAVPNPPAGFKGWVSKAVSCDNPAKLIGTQWDWSRNGTGVKGSFWRTRPAVNSATAANGAAIFNSDFLDNKGDGTSFGLGVSPSPHGADIVSPTMDMTGKSDLTLVFNQYYRSFDVNAMSVTWSEDGGATWKDTISAVENSSILRFEEINNQVVMKLPKSKGTANFKVKFIFEGDYYFWIIDDVKLVTINNNLRVNKTWYATPQNYAMTRQQVDTVVFMADIENQGNRTATNVKLTVDIRNASNASVYNVVRNYGSIKPDSVAENQVFGKWMPPTSGSGTVGFTGSYVITSDSLDAFPTNDTIRFSFLVTDSLFQNDAAGGNIESYKPFGAKAWKVGNYFYFPNGANVTATRIRVAMDTFTMAGVPLVARLYSWNDANNDRLVQETERIEIAAGEATVPRVTTQNVIVDFNLQNTVSSGVVKLKDKTAYIAMLEFDPPTSANDMYFNFSESIAYFPMHVATFLAGKPRFTGVINNGDDTAPWSTNIFGGERRSTPYIRMWSWPLKTDTKEPLSANNKIELFPNPTSSTLNVAFDLEKTEQAVLVRIIDMTGKIIKERDYTNLKKETVSMDVNDVPNGVYNIQIQTIGNFRTMRFVKAN